MCGPNACRWRVAARGNVHPCCKQAVSRGRVERGAGALRVRVRVRVSVVLRCCVARVYLRVHARACVQESVYVRARAPVFFFCVCAHVWCCEMMIVLYVMWWLSALSLCSRSAMARAWNPSSQPLISHLSMSPAHRTSPLPLRPPPEPAAAGLLLLLLLLLLLPPLLGVVCSRCYRLHIPLSGPRNRWRWRERPTGRRAQRLLCGWSVQGRAKRAAAVMLMRHSLCRCCIW